MYGCSQVIKLRCGEDHSRIAAAKLDLWLLIERKKNSTSGLIMATEEAVRKTTHLGKM